MKKRFLTLFAAAALVAFAAVAFAAPRGGRGLPPKAPLTPAQRTAIEKVFAAHQENLYNLREQIWAKHAELQALTVSGKAEKSDIQSLIGDISRLRNAMHKERLAIRREITTKTGIKNFGPCGFHHGFGGYGACGGEGCAPDPGGRGMGHGMGMGPGMGPGMGGE